MNFDFLTPEIFDMLVIANLIVAVLLMAFRFYQDVNHSNSKQHREQLHDESSHEYLSETDQSGLNTSQAINNTKQQKSQNQ